MKAITLAGYRQLGGTPPGDEPSLPSIKVPAGARRVQCYLVTPNGIRQDPDTVLKGSAEYTFDPPSAGVNRQWIGGGESVSPGAPDLISGGIAVDNPDDFVPGSIDANTGIHWEFDPRDSMGGGALSQTAQDTTVKPPVDRPIDQCWMRPAYRIMKSSGNVWVAVVAVATDIDGNELEFDLSTRL